MARRALGRPKVVVVAVEMMALLTSGAPPSAALTVFARFRLFLPCLCPWRQLSSEELSRAILAELDEAGSTPRQDGQQGSIQFTTGKGRTFALSSRYRAREIDEEVKVQVLDLLKSNMKDMLVGTVAAHSAVGGRLEVPCAGAHGSHSP